MDLQDREHNTKDGLHIASLAGAWTALVSGFGGMRRSDGQLCFSPKLPPGIVGLSFRMRFRGRTVLVAVHDHAATYSLLAGDPLEITHYGEPATIGDKELTLDIPTSSRRHRRPSPRPRPPAPPRPLQLARSPPARRVLRPRASRRSRFSSSRTEAGPAAAGFSLLRLQFIPNGSGSGGRGLRAAPASVHPERKRLTPHPSRYTRPCSPPPPVARHFGNVGQGAAGEARRGRAGRCEQALTHEPQPLPNGFPPRVRPKAGKLAGSGGRQGVRWGADVAADGGGAPALELDHVWAKVVWREWCVVSVGTVREQARGARPRAAA